MITHSETITCPKCGQQFAVDDALSSQICGSMEADWHKLILMLEKQLAEQKEAFDQEAKKNSGQNAREEFAQHLHEMQRALEECNKLVEYFRRQEFALRQKQRKVEEGPTALELDVARRLDEEREKMRNDTVTKIQQEERRRKDLEKDMIIRDLKAELDDMKLKAEHGSMEAQGEMLEQDVEDQLRRIFSGDYIRAVKKGECGTDLVQTVRNDKGKDCGTILWEIESTKAWNKDYAQKLKDDIRREKASIGILTSIASREGVVQFGHGDGVWISEPAYAVAIASALRQQLIAVEYELHGGGNDEKIDTLYDYIADAEFRQRIESVVKDFRAMRRRPIAEKAAVKRQWAEKEKQIMRIVMNSNGAYGDFCGLIGGSAPAIPALQLGEGNQKALGAGDNNCQSSRQHRL